MVKTYFVFLFPFFAPGCIITNTPGFFSGYKEISAEQKQNIVFVSDDLGICNLKNDKKIYSITANQLLKCLQGNDSTIVYFWSPNCSSKSCVLLDAAQRYCDKNNYHLYVITEYYDLEKIDLQNNAGSSLFSVNHQYYKTDYCNKYMRLFTHELLKNGELSGSDKYRRYYLFHKDNFIKTKESIFDQ